MDGATRGYEGGRLRSPTPEEEIGTNMLEVQAKHEIGPKTIRPRRMRFTFDDSIPTDWCGDVFLSRYLDALSITFPEGEQFFVDSVRAYREQVRDPAQKAAIQGFVAQEALHSREHQALNRWLASRGYPVEEMEQVVVMLLSLARRFPEDWQLGFTCSLEHCTAILGEYILGDESVRAIFHERMRPLWMWHALEEAEHKGVAFDVYREVSDAYGVRVTTHLMATAFFLVATTAFAAEMVRRDGRATELSVWTSGARKLWGREGHFRRLVPEWMRYFRRDFHPWERDSRALIATWEAKLAAA